MTHGDFIELDAAAGIQLEIHISEPQVRLKPDPRPSSRNPESRYEIVPKPNKQRNAMLMCKSNLVTLLPT